MLRRIGGVSPKNTFVRRVENWHSSRICVVSFLQRESFSGEVLSNSYSPRRWFQGFSGPLLIFRIDPENGYLENLEVSFELQRVHDSIKSWDPVTQTLVDLPIFDTSLWADGTRHASGDFDLIAKWASPQDLLVSITEDDTVPVTSCIVSDLTIYFDAQEQFVGVLISNLSDAEVAMIRKVAPERPSRYSQEELAKRGTEIYERDIRGQVESGNKDSIVALDIETGQYTIADNASIAKELLEERLPDPEIWFVRIGYKKHPESAI